MASDATVLAARLLGGAATEVVRACYSRDDVRGWRGSVEAPHETDLNDVVDAGSPLPSQRCALCGTALSPVSKLPEQMRGEVIGGRQRERPGYALGRVAVDRGATGPFTAPRDGAPAREGIAGDYRRGLPGRRRLRRSRTHLLPAVEIDEAGERRDRIEHREDIRDLERRPRLRIPHQVAFEDEAPVDGPGRVGDREDRGRA